VSRTDDRHVRVVVAGPIGLRTAPMDDPSGLRTGLADTSSRTATLAAAADQDRTVVASLQRRDPLISSDLGWKTVATTQLVLRGRGANDRQVAWVGELDAPESIVASRPGSGPGEWRVMVEEWEQLEADPVRARSPRKRSTRQWEQRLIYADAFDL
ncbi:MAG: hypothetical protein ABI114_09220, partial [Rhodanobacter sp.]